MGLASMTIYRVKKLLAWAFALVILALLVAGVYWVASGLGWIT